MSLYTAQAQASQSPYRVMVVDDSAIIRGILARQLETDPLIKIVASCANGQIAVERMKEANPDVIVLDIEMPVMDGLTALPLLRKINGSVKIIIASTLTLRNAEISLNAMRMGAHDYIPKPTSTSEAMGSSAFQHELLEKIKTWGQKKRQNVFNALSVPKPSVSTSPSKLALITLKPYIIGIGVSTGGPQALLDILTPLQGICHLPILITQHMPPRFTTVLAQHLQTASGCIVKEATHNEKIENGTVYIAPGDHHMVVIEENREKKIALTQSPHENFCRPSVDPMFKSIAEQYGPKALCFILTGMGSDGTKGSKIITDAGGHVIAQDEETSVVWGMPGSIVQAGVTKNILSLPDIAQILKNIVQHKGL